MRLEPFTITHQGLVRETNQDAILDLSELGVFAVADGMGGEQAGDEASAQTVATLRDAVLEFFKATPRQPGQIEQLLTQGLLRANHDVRQIAVREPAKLGLGSTASVLCLHRGAWFLAHVGDSRIYLVRDGAVRQLTRDHTVVWRLYEQGRISRDHLERHPERHLLTQCVGTPHPLHVDLARGALRPGDLFMICSDGLTGYAAEERIQLLLREPAAASVADRAQTLLDEALAAGGGDNVSVALVRVAALDIADDWAVTPLQNYPMPAQPDAAAPDVDPNAETLDNNVMPPARPTVHEKKTQLGALLVPVAISALTLLIAAYLILWFFRVV